MAGNCPKTWNYVDECLSESTDPVIGIRVLIPGSKNFRAYVKRDKLRATIKNLGLNHGEYVLTVTIPPSEYRLAGELGWCNGSWVFFHSYVQRPMREALAIEGAHVYGQDVWNLLEKYCTPSDLDDLRDLFDYYSVDGSYPVIEFTVTRNDCGMIPHRNTLIWEIRHY